MSKGIELNLPYVLIQHMINTIESGHKKISLPYGMFLTKVFRHFEVSLKGQEGKNSSTTFTMTNVGRMKQVSEIEDHTVSDQGQKRKRKDFEDLELLAEVVTTTQDHSENILPAYSKGKETQIEGNPSVSQNPFVSLEFDSALGSNLDSSVNKFTTVLLDGLSTMDNPVNTTMFSPLISSPYSAFETFQS
jgi:hypothetical protein